MDPLSIAAFTVKMASMAGKIIEGSGKFGVEARAVRSNVDEFKDTIKLQKLAKDPGPLDKATASFVMTLRPNVIRDSVSHITSSPSTQSDDSNTVSDSPHDFDDMVQDRTLTSSRGSSWSQQKSQEQIHKEIRELTNAIRSANLLSRASISHRRPSIEQDDDIETRVKDSVSMTKEIQAWRMSADEVAAVVTLQDADRRNSFLFCDHSVSKLSLDNDIGSPPATLGDVESDDWDPEPDHPDGPSKDILSHQYDANQ
ncbi:hypothetical protein CSHISOI_03660 [Colletotrichum shisoi]|uniref:Uncharacterized protein n=1 Tax=Colletotrichum shisoi TaxID=2078593 RepID=A0A5Q4BZ46_9PEZI|nr:hypothetical protein CSHISOI_03660 [Colletotrichum shisoi]